MRYASAVDSHTFLKSTQCALNDFCTYAYITLFFRHQHVPFCFHQTRQSPTFAVVHHTWISNALLLLYQSFTFKLVNNGNILKLKSCTILEDISPLVICPYNSRLNGLSFPLHQYTHLLNVQKCEKSVVLKFY